MPPRRPIPPPRYGRRNSAAPMSADDRRVRRGAPASGRERDRAPLAGRRERHVARQRPGRARAARPRSPRPSCCRTAALATTSPRSARRLGLACRPSGTISSTDEPVRRERARSCRGTARPRGSSDSIAFACWTSAPKRMIRTAPSAYAIAIETNRPFGTSPTRSAASPTVRPAVDQLQHVVEDQHDLEVDDDREDDPDDEVDLAPGAA